MSVDDSRVRFLGCPWFFRVRPVSSFQSVNSTTVEVEYLFCQLTLTLRTRLLLYFDQKEDKGPERYDGR